METMEKIASEVLVDTQWVADHLSDSSVRIIESNEDPLLYDIGHIQNAIKVDWFTTLQDPIRRDFLKKEAFEELCRSFGIDHETTVVFYGDKSNWFACYAFWLFRYYGHEDLRIMDGGRQKWLAEERGLVSEIPAYPLSDYEAQAPDISIRAFRQDVFVSIEIGGLLVDVRSQQEYAGEMLHMPDYPQEGAARGGHIPGAINIPWSQAINDDGTFKSKEELFKLYGDFGVTPDEEIIAYCRIGERSAHSWFVLTELLGYSSVKNYDGSWTEWGNLVNAPIEKSV